ncbi:MAG: phosphoribosylaminoimidazolesuccinocarboxamide synthase [Methanoculleus sp.]
MALAINEVLQEYLDERDIALVDFKLRVRSP